MKQLHEQVVKCMSQNRLNDAYTVVIGALAADGLRVYSKSHLVMLVEILGCLQETNTHQCHRDDQEARNRDYDNE